MITIEVLRTHRVFGYALIDLTLAFVGIYLLSPLLTKLFRKVGLIIPKQSWMYATLPLGILVHILVSNDTLMTRNFLDTQGHYLLKASIIILTYLGIRGIKKNK